MEGQKNLPVLALHAAAGEVTLIGGDQMFDAKKPAGVSTVPTNAIGQCCWAHDARVGL